MMGVVSLFQMITNPWEKSNAVSIFDCVPGRGRLPIIGASRRADPRRPAVLCQCSPVGPEAQRTVLPEG